jgi:hypothetical protein
MSPLVPALELVIVAASTDASADASGAGPSPATTPASLLDEPIVSGAADDEIAPETSTDVLGASVVGTAISAMVGTITGVATSAGGAGDAIAESVGGSLDEIGSGAEELRKRRCSLETLPVDVDPVYPDVQPSSVLEEVWSSAVAVEVVLVVASDPVDEVSDAGATGVTG